MTRNGSSKMQGKVEQSTVRERANVANSSLSQNLMSASDDLDETLQRGSSEDVSQPLVSNIYEILSWVAGSEDQALLHEHYRAERIPGTYEWFLETDTYRSWLQATLPQGDRGLFWCQGKPGIGKTILTWVYSLFPSDLQH